MAHDRRPTSWTTALDFPGLSQEALLDLAIKKAELDRALEGAEGEASREAEFRARRKLDQDFQAAKRRVEMGLPAIPPPPPSRLIRTLAAVWEAMGWVAAVLWRRKLWLVPVLVVAAFIAVIVHLATREPAPKPPLFEPVCYTVATNIVTPARYCRGGAPGVATEFYPLDRWGDGTDRYPAVLATTDNGEPLPAGGVDQLPPGACAAEMTTFGVGYRCNEDGVW